MSDERIPTRGTLVFGTFELDLAAATLTRRGIPVKLQRQPFRVLAALAARPGEIVAREELRDLLWSDGTVVDYEHALNFCVYRIRRALGDTAESPRFVETLARRGYRFIAPVVCRPVKEDSGTGARAPVAPAAASSTQAIVGAPDVSRSMPRPAARHGTFAWLLRLAAVAAAVLVTGAGPRLAGGTDNPEARAAFDLGRSLAAQGAVGTRRAVGAFARATALDPGFAGAHAALARAYLDLGFLGQLPPREAFPAARRAARAALAIADRVDAHTVLASVALFYDWDWTTAGAELARAQALDPNDACATVLRARYWSALGRSDTAVAAVDRAETLNPGSAAVLEVSGLVHARAGRFDDAERKFRTAIQMGAGPWVRFRLFDLYRQRGRPAQAVEQAAHLLADSGVDGGRVQHFIGLPRDRAIDHFLHETADYLEHTLSAAEPIAVRMAVVRTALGERTAALDWLDKAAAARDPALVEALGDGGFDALRGEPRFRNLAARVGPHTAASTAGLTIGPRPPALVASRRAIELGPVR
jgi:DNA-binding winged helix-turn-helix (wHTH) protein/tetratricopeptide (TPR) repeat protein